MEDEDATETPIEDSYVFFFALQCNVYGTRFVFQVLRTTVKNNSIAIGSPCQTVGTSPYHNSVLTDESLAWCLSVSAKYTWLTRPVPEDPDPRFARTFSTC